MANILEYILKITTDGDKTIKKLGLDGDGLNKTFKKLNIQARSYQKQVGAMGVSINSLSSKIKLLESTRDAVPRSVGGIAKIRKLNAEINRTERQITKLRTINGSPIKKAFSNAFNSIPALLTNPITLIGATIGAAVKEGASKDMQLANLTTLLDGNAAAAENLYKKVRKYANVTPYDTSGLVKAQQTMMSFGISSDKSFKTLKQLGDISLGDSEKMQSLALAFSQATSNGKLQGQDLLQMINAGFNPLNVISQKTGKSMAELKQEMAKGQIGADQLAQAFEWATEKGGKFYKGADKAGKTLGGRISTLADSFKTLLLSVYDAIEPIISPLIDLATKVLNTIGGGLTWLITKFKEGNPVILTIAGTIAFLTTAILAYNAYTAIAAGIQNLLTGAVWKTNLAFMANPVFWVVAGIVALIAVIGVLIYAFDGWGKAWQHVVNGAKLLWQSFVASAKFYFDTLINGIMIGIDKIKVGWYKFKIAMGIGDKSESQSLLDAANADVERRKSEIKKEAKDVIDLAAKARNEFSQVFGANGLHYNGKLNHLKEKITSKILPATTPGVTPSANGTGSGGTGGGNTAAGKGMATNNAIATGGTKNTTVNISIGEFVKTMNVTAGNLNESATKIKDVIIDHLARAVSMGASLGAA